MELIIVGILVAGCMAVIVHRSSVTVNDAAKEIEELEQLRIRYLDACDEVFRICGAEHPEAAMVASYIMKCGELSDLGSGNGIHELKIKLRALKRNT